MALGSSLGVVPAAPAPGIAAPGAMPALVGGPGAAMAAPAPMRPADGGMAGFNPPNHDYQMNVQHSPDRFGGQLPV